MRNSKGKNYKPITNFFWLRGVSIDEIPADCRNVYFRLLNTLVAYHKDLIDKIIMDYGGKISFPIETDIIEHYLTGWKINYIPFNGLLRGVEGYWELDPKEKGVINIYYNFMASSARQRFTKIHEIFHFCQWLDMSLHKFFDELLSNTTLPIIVIQRLLEKSADKATAMYLMPATYFIKKYEELKNISELSDYFQASKQATTYRLKECGCLLIN